MAQHYGRNGPRKAAPAWTRDPEKVQAFFDELKREREEKEDA